MFGGQKSMEKNGKYVFGTVRVGERGQIVIPKQCREVFDIKPGDTLLILGDEERGIGIMKQDCVMDFIKDVFSAPAFNSEGKEESK
ncbi:MAG: AbrB/MazE/SpoVT family DNA-binding domain-containing protein [Clostridia bacterium]|nr:AbrB/MazE/SpoVT family DNA-binding domain-containing protein [Clostridia bacterium]